MNVLRQKMAKIVDELYNFMFSAGAESVQMEIALCEGGYRLTVDSGYDPAQRKKVDDLERFLVVQEKNEGLEEFFWELAGVSGLGDDSELHLIGQMVDRAEVEIGPHRVHLVLYKLAD